LKPIAYVLGKDVNAKSGGQHEKLITGDDEAGKKNKKKDKKKNKKHEDKKENEPEPDPLNYLGFGMVAYRDLMFTMFWLFAVLSLIMLPALMFYNGQGAINAENKKGFAGPLSMGSFGYASSQCQIAPFDLNIVPITCQYGELGTVVSAGVIPSGKGEFNTMCHTSVDKDLEISALCPLRADLVSYINSKVTKISKQKFSFSEYDILDKTKTVSPTCTDINAKVFVQFTCLMSDTQMSEKREQASMISCLGVLMVLVYLTVLYFFKRSSDLNQMEWDIQTITPGDYTSQFEITAKAFKFFMEQQYPRFQQRKSDISITEALKSYIKVELERVLTDKLVEMKQSTGNENIKINEVKIADIVFAFNNAQLIQLLKTRGMHIQFQRYNEMRDTEKLINHVIQTEFEKLTRPVDAFITFEEEDGLIVSQEFEP